MPFGQEQEEIQIPPHDAPAPPPIPRVVRRLGQAPTPAPVTFGGIGSWLLSNSFVLIIGFAAGYLTARYLNRE